MTEELQPLGGKRIIQGVGYVCIVLGFIVFFSEHIVGSWPVFDAGQAVSATSAQNKNGGLSSGAISDLQARLSQDPTIYPEGIVSGIYGELTTKAVMRFQKKYQLAATGAADGVTLQKIHDVFALPGGAPVKTSVAPPVKKTAPVVVVKPKADSILVFDQFGKAVSRAKVWFVDNEGRQFPEGWYDYVSTNDNGSTEFSYAPKSERNVPDGNYTVHIAKDNYSPLEVPIEFKTDESIKYIQVIPHTFTIQKWGVIAAVFVDQFGKPPSSLSMVIDDMQGKTLGQSFGQQTGRFEMPPLPDGQYFLRTYPSQTYYEPFEQVVRMEGGKDIFLGNISLVKK